MQTAGRLSKSVWSLHLIQLFLWVSFKQAPSCCQRQLSPHKKLWWPAWRTILHEWIERPILLCAFDMALYNRLLRERYLIWLYDGTKRGRAFNIFSLIHFETTLEHDVHSMSHQGVPDIFFDWCKRRRINPKSLSYCFEPTNESGKWEWKTPKVMKQVEQLKAIIDLLCCG